MKETTWPQMNFDLSEKSSSRRIKHLHNPVLGELGSKEGVGVLNLFLGWGVDGFDAVSSRCLVGVAT